MRSRNIKPGFFKNEELVELSAYARLLFLGLWTLADREGRLEDRPKRIKLEILPHDKVDVDKLLEELANSPERFIVRYSVDGENYIWIPNFVKHQNPHKNEKPSQIPAYGDIAKLREDSRIIGTNPADSLNPDSLNPDSKTLLSTRKSESTVFEYWKQQMGKNSRTVLDPPRRTAIKRALKVLTVEEALAAVLGCSLTPHNMGDNDRHQKYNDLTLIFRDAAHWERFIETAKGRGAAPPRIFSGEEERLIAKALKLYREGKYAESQAMLPDELWLEVKRRGKDGHMV